MVTFPAVFPVDEMKLLIDAFDPKLKASHTTREYMAAAWWLLGYSQGQSLPLEPTPPTPNPEPPRVLTLTGEHCAILRECVQHHEACCDGRVSGIRIDWHMILSIAQTLLGQLDHMLGH